MIDTKSTILHPPRYRQMQIAPALRRNELTKEVVWTYLVAKKYENDQPVLVKKLCGVEEKLPEDPKIYLEAYLHPTRIKMEERKCWLSRSDLAIGCLELVKDRQLMIKAAGEWICIVESKFFSDIDPNFRFPDIFQLSQLIEHALLLHKKRSIPPKRVYVILVTPQYFTNQMDRMYWQKYHDYTKDPTTLVKDLKLCNLPFLEHDEATLLSRIESLKLRWVTFEKLLDLPEIMASGKFQELNFATWKEIFREIRMLELYHEIIEGRDKNGGGQYTAPVFNHPQNISTTWDKEALQTVDQWLRQQLQTLPVGEPIFVGGMARESRKIAKVQNSGNSEGVRYLLWKLHEEGYVDFSDETHFVVRGEK